MGQHDRAVAAVRVRILTPVDVNSAVAAKSLAIAEELSKHIEVDVVGEPTEFPRMAKFPVHPYPPSPKLSTPDFWLVALGSSGFHKAALHFLLEQPSLVMLHDLSLFGAATVETGTLAMDGAFGELIQSEYGPEALESAQRAQGQNDFGLDVELSFLRRYLRKAQGVITHSNFAVDAVRRNTVAPVRLARLPMTEPVETHERSNPVLLSLGHVNDNRSMPLILEALSLVAPELRPLYRVVGPINPDVRSRLEHRTRQLGISDSVIFTGRVTETELRRELGSASLFVNLRNPVLEAASDSLLRQMASGAPTIVYNHGCYAEVPDNTVVKLPLDTTPHALARQFERLLREPSVRVSLGTAAREYLQREHGVEQYATAVLELIAEVSSGQSRAEMLRRLARSMEGIGLLSDDPVVKSIAEAENFLFGPGNSDT
jgi:glycosyltransferase involved in cell wall biosynthesis